MPTPQVVGDGVTEMFCFVKFTVAEPLLISPWIWANPQSNNQAFYGVQNLNFQMTIGNANRVWRSSTAKTCSIVGFSNSQLCFNFLTLKCFFNKPPHIIIITNSGSSRLSLGSIKRTKANTSRDWCTIWEPHRIPASHPHIGSLWSLWAVSANSSNNSFGNIHGSFILF